MSARRRRRRKSTAPWWRITRGCAPRSETCGRRSSSCRLRHHRSNSSSRQGLRYPAAAAAAAAAPAPAAAAATTGCRRRCCPWSGWLKPLWEQGTGGVAAAQAAQLVQELRDFLGAVDGARGQARHAAADATLARLDDARDCYLGAAPAPAPDANMRIWSPRCHGEQGVRGCSLPRNPLATRRSFPAHSMMMLNSNKRTHASLYYYCTNRT